MQKFFVLLSACLIVLPAKAFAQTAYKIDPNHANLTWMVSHFGFSHPSGKFPDVEGRFVLDEKTPQKSTLTVRVGTASLITGISKFDEHLKSADFLDVTKFPHAYFRSERIELTGENAANVTGILTLKGIDRPLTLAVKLNKLGLNPANDKKTAGFSATGAIKRSDYGIVYALPGVADEVTLKIEVEGQAEE